MTSFERAAQALAAKASELSRGRRLVLVGHSLGGLLARYVSEIDGVAADMLITLATPHRGTTLADGFPGSMARSLRPGSQLLTQLGPASPASPHRHRRRPRYGDHSARESAHSEGALVHTLSDVGHNGLLFDPRAHRLIADTIRELENT